MQEGLAVLKVGSSFKSVKTNDNKIITKNNILYSTKLKFTLNSELANLPNKLSGSTIKERLNFCQDKKLYEDKATRTVKNFIGKSCYNVRYPLNF